ETMLNENWKKIDENVAMVNAQGKVINKDGSPAGGVTEEEFTTHLADYTLHVNDETAHGIGNKATLLTSQKTTIVSAVNELFTNVSDGKSLVGGAITGV